MEDFAKSFIRRLGGGLGIGNAHILTGASNAAAVAVTMEAKDCAGA